VKVPQNTNPDISTDSHYVPNGQLYPSRKHLRWLNNS